MTKKVSDEQLLEIIRKYNRMVIRKGLISHYIGGEICLNVLDPESAVGKRRKEPRLYEHRTSFWQGYIYKFINLSPAQVRFRLKKLAAEGKIWRRGSEPHWQYSMSEEWCRKVLNEEIQKWLDRGVGYVNYDNGHAEGLVESTSERQAFYDSSEFEDDVVPVEQDLCDSCLRLEDCSHDRSCGVSECIDYWDCLEDNND